MPFVEEHQTILVRHYTDCNPEKLKLARESKTKN